MTGLLPLLPRALVMNRSTAGEAGDGLARLAPWLAGLVLAAGTILMGFMVDPRLRLALLAVFLASMAALYFGFAVVDGRLRWLAAEVLVGGALLGFAVAGLRVAPGFLAAGFVAHATWDFAHHPRGIQTEVAWWFPPLCAVYDLILAGAVLAWWPPAWIL